VPEPAPPAPPGIEPGPVARFFAEQVPGGKGPLRFALIAGGRSNLTFRVEVGGDEAPEQTFVLRRPPLGHVLPTAHDMAREYRVLAALADTGLPVPRPFALCEDPEVNGAPFYVMEHREGVVLGERLPEGFATRSQERRRIGEALMETLAALHAVDFRAVGLGDFGRPAGYLERQVARWAKQWERSKVEELPLLDELARRLRAALPAHPDATLVHGDYRLGNVALDPDDPGRIAAIFDWEMATLGDPLADLGYTLIYWGEPGDGPRAGAVEPYSKLTAGPGFHSRAELVEAYAQASGRAVDDVAFYQVLALYKLAVISEGIYARHLQGKTVGEGFEGLQRTSVALAERALAVAEAAESPALRGR